MKGNNVNTLPKVGDYVRVVRPSSSTIEGWVVKHNDHYGRSQGWLPLVFAVDVQNNARQFYASASVPEIDGLAFIRQGDSDQWEVIEPPAESSIVEVPLTATEIGYVVRMWNVYSDDSGTASTVRHKLYLACKAASDG